MARPFLLIEDSYAEVQAFMRLVTRIGLAEKVKIDSTTLIVQVELAPREGR